MPDNFRNHLHYLESWEGLYLNEIYHILMSSKRSTEDKPLDLNGESFKSTSKKDLKFTAFLLLDQTSFTSKFAEGKLIDKFPSGCTLEEVKDMPEP